MKKTNAMQNLILNDVRYNILRVLGLALYSFYVVWVYIDILATLAFLLFVIDMHNCRGGTEGKGACIIGMHNCTRTSLSTAVLGRFSVLDHKP